MLLAVLQQQGNNKIEKVNGHRVKFRLVNITFHNKSRIDGDNMDKNMGGGGAMKSIFKNKKFC